MFYFTYVCCFRGARQEDIKNVLVLSSRLIKATRGTWLFLTSDKVTSLYNKTFLLYITKQNNLVGLFSHFHDKSHVTLFWHIMRSFYLKAEQYEFSKDVKSIGLELRITAPVIHHIFVYMQLFTLFLSW